MLAGVTKLIISPFFDITAITQRGGVEFKSSNALESSFA
jgi:hypothetical protein